MAEQNQQGEPEIACRDGCKRTAGTGSGWTYLPLSRQWRCPQCTRELREANETYSQEYYVNEEKKLDAEILGHMQRLDLKPGDKLLVIYPFTVSDDALRVIEAHIQQRLPDHKVIVLAGDPKVGSDG